MNDKINEAKAKFDTNNPMTKKLIKYIIIGFIVVIVGIILLMVIKQLFFSRISVNKLEDKMEIAARKYYTEFPELLPESDKETVSISIDELVNNGNLKSLDKLIKPKDASCQGSVTVTRNGNYYLYSPYLECTDLYKTKRLYEEIINDKNIVEEKDGVYHIGNKYYYRGENVNNYLKFANQIWRIISVDEEDHSIKIIQEEKTEDKYIWDNRYNDDKSTDSGINEFDTSRMKETLENIWSNGEIIADTYKPYIVNKPLCVAPRSEDESDKTGTVECQITYKEGPLSLLLPSDYMMASLDKLCNSTINENCNNYNYLYYKDTGIIWSLTPALENSTEVYNFTPDISTIRANREYYIKLVVNLSSETRYTHGDGSKDNPFIIK